MDLILSRTWNPTLPLQCLFIIANNTYPNTVFTFNNSCPLTSMCPCVHGPRTSCPVSYSLHQIASFGLSKQRVASCFAASVDHYVHRVVRSARADRYAGPDCPANSLLAGQCVNGSINASQTMLICARFSETSERPIGVGTDRAFSLLYFTPYTQHPTPSKPRGENVKIIDHIAGN